MNALLEKGVVSNDDLDVVRDKIQELLDSQEGDDLTTMLLIMLNEEKMTSQ